MKLFLFTVLAWMLCLPAVLGQEYGYTHYDSKEGLAGSTVYCMVQDPAGFLWFGTEGGLSRFDGTHFKSFTREDGLPDNEVLQVFADSKGRIWIAPFKKTVCYYYKGKIYTQDNDPVLKQIHFTDFVNHFAEDKAGNILMQETRKLHVVTAQGSVTTIDSIGSQPVTYINAICGNAGNGFTVLEGNRMYDYSNNRFRLRKTIPVFLNHFIYYAMESRAMIWQSDSATSRSVSVTGNAAATFAFQRSHIGYTVIDDDRVGQCTGNGAFIYNIRHTDSTRQFLPGIAVSRILQDAEGGLWFSTLGHGVYKLSSLYVLNVKLPSKQPAQVFALTRYKESILAGTDVHVIYRLNRATARLEKENINIPYEVDLNPIFAIMSYRENNVLCGTGISLYKLGPGMKILDTIKHIVIKGFSLCGNRLYVATNKNTLIVNADTWKITDTIWPERSTTVYVSNDTAYIGTLTGLYRRLPDRTVQFLGDKTPALKARITAIQGDANGILWVGTYGDGLIGYRNDQVVAILNRRSGLTSNVCRTLFLNGNFLWMGTDKGISKINLAQPGYPVIKYTTGDGLASDIINALYVDSNKVFVGTPQGVTFFDEEKMINQSRCDLRFVDITVSDQLYFPDQAPRFIPHEKNSIQFNFVGISYKSVGDIRYRYRLLGLDSNWKETRETFLSYPALPSGDYQLQIQAVNKFDISSQLLTASFTIDKLLYERTWFRILMVLLFLALTGLVVWLIICRVRKREQEKTALSKRISELEQLSRKAQMNPHFIFNSLNSIQQYVMDTDVVGANKFIAGFSRLIRQTLDFSSKPEISLEEELDYLGNYLEIERTRLENAFSWSVIVERGLDQSEYYIPPMILQPFVENSVRHGLRFRRDKKGLVTITVKRENNHLVCIVEDNGVGRKAAMQYKSVSPINYQSKGLSLTADRIAMFNQEHEQKITMQIDDLEDDEQAPLGTRVTISFPVL